MPNLPDALWLNVSPSFQAFDRPLLHDLSQYIAVTQWEYSQSMDEPASLDAALDLLHEYLQTHHSSPDQTPTPIHLLGHSMGGVLALLYARCHPEWVKSLTLLAVGYHLAINWQAHYYTLLQMLLCDRQLLLRQMVCHLFGYPAASVVKNLITSLEQDLENSPTLHSLFKRGTIPSGGAPLPMLICGGQDDIIVDPVQLQRWKPELKPGDRLWQCPEGRHFFHYFYAELVSEQIISFWDRLQASDPLQNQQSYSLRAGGIDCKAPARER
ncbi:MAG: alpha/beta hydrolase [Oscillatoriales cyanobacterium RM1_1_9]|nr:alpha/beta hydrolase [Oscillatoriales cyanobacterium SM2_3_0]NJO47036.1 alpha/beta hydrolase [Oscillatoriales cyanobacterium RM2_1_1]NJO71670.1 alpha/beta hydrolase [Oscillatoriales cyanobacterium RM1_1_9]